MCLFFLHYGFLTNCWILREVIWNGWQKIYRFKLHNNKRLQRSGECPRGVLVNKKGCVWKWHLYGFVFSIDSIKWCLFGFTSHKKNKKRLLKFSAFSFCFWSFCCIRTLSISYWFYFISFYLYIFSSFCITASIWFYTLLSTILLEAEEKLAKRINEVEKHRANYNLSCSYVRWL